MKKCDPAIDMPRTLQFSDERMRARLRRSVLRPELPGRPVLLPQRGPARERDRPAEDPDAGRVRGDDARDLRWHERLIHRQKLCIGHVL